MKKYKITYMVKGTDSISPLIAMIFAENEELASKEFCGLHTYYNTTDVRKIVIESIREVK